jgi:ribosomal protein S16
MFDTRLKIGVQPMYPVGTLEWALELHKHEIVPGLFYSDSEKENHYMTTNEWKQFFDVTNRVIITMNARHFRDKKFIEWAVKYKPKYIEIQNGATAKEEDHIGKHSEDLTILKLLKSFAKLYIKDIVFYGKQFSSEVKNLMDAVNVKNSRAAGSNTTHSLEESIIYAKENFNLPIIASGGIYTKQDHMRALKLGADCVLLGSVFAMSTESNLSSEAKHLVLTKQGKDIKQLGPDHRNGLSLGSVDNNDDNNLTKNLNNLSQHGNNGVVYVGKGIDSITSIQPIKEIVKIFN